MKIIKLYQSLLLCLIFSSCTSVFYQPDRYLYSDPIKLGLKIKNIYFPSKDGTMLHGWHLKTKEKVKGLIFLFHGNAQNLSSHYLNVAWLTKHGYEVFVTDYRGYGLSKGEANPKGVYEDSLASLNKAYQLFKSGGGDKLILMGQSLGGAILGRAYKDLSFKKEIDLIVLDSTFYSYRKMAAAALRRHPVTWIFSPLGWLLVGDKYASTDALPTITNPTLVMHGNKDRAVPYYFGQDIYNMLTTEKKWFWTIKNGQHIDSFASHKGIYRKRFLQLLKNL